MGLDRRMEGDRDPDGDVKEEIKKAKDKYLVTFGKGSRSCVGRDLVYYELFLTL